MEDIKFTRDDRAFLRQMHIDPQDKDEDIGEINVILFKGSDSRWVCVSVGIALEIVERYGELNAQNYIQYISDRNSDKGTD